MNGVVIIDKPRGLTSHDVVNRVRRIVGQRSVGHLGTLDPMATGVLPLVVGNLTRLAQFYAHSEKSYEGEIRFGFATDTYDADGDPTTEEMAVDLVEAEVREAAQLFEGLIRQMPPPFSAKKIAGVPAYKLARKKAPVELNAVEVRIESLVITSVSRERAHFQARVSSGTYIRSIAHEIGQKLGCGAHLSCLRRTAVAEFSIDQAKTLAALEEATRQGGAGDLLVHPRMLLPEMPSVTTTEEIATMIRNGRSINLPEMSRAKLIKVFLGEKELIAIAMRVAGTLFKPRIVFHPTEKMSELGVLLD
jgi:tRNA pseudouridine55 synthase